MQCLMMIFQTNVSMLATASVLFIACLPQWVTSLMSDNHDSSPSHDWLAHHLNTFSHLGQTYNQVIHERLSIDLVRSYPSSLVVTWHLSNRTHGDSVLEATVLCETGNGKIVSDKSMSAEDSFHFKHLDSNTRYIVCVYMLEKLNTSVAKPNVLHFKCQPFDTIPVVRSDSILGVILTLGYVVLMGGIGYMTWWRARQILKEREERRACKRMRQEALEYSDNDCHEREKLTNNAFENEDALEMKSRHLGAHGDVGGNDVGMSADKSPKPGGVCCAGGRAPKFKPIVEEDPVQLNVKDREISF